jgi:hypothetical protein
MCEAHDRVAACCPHRLSSFKACLDRLAAQACVENSLSLFNRYGQDTDTLWSGS